MAASTFQILKKKLPKNNKYFCAVCSNIIMYFIKISQNVILGKKYNVIVKDTCFSSFLLQQIPPLQQSVVHGHSRPGGKSAFPVQMLQYLEGPISPAHILAREGESNCNQSKEENKINHNSCRQEYRLGFAEVTVTNISGLKLVFFPASCLTMDSSPSSSLLWGPDRQNYHLPFGTWSVAMEHRKGREESKVSLQLNT